MPLAAPAHKQSRVEPALPTRADSIRRVLIVSPHFPPVNAPDHQRVRMALPYLAANEWEAEVLAIAPGFVEAPLDAALAAALPSRTRIHRVPAISPRCSRRLGWSSLARRSYSFLRESGVHLLREGRFDLVFFSTSQFGVLPLARHWQQRSGVPYVLDFHDEWISDYYRRHPHVVPPGGRCKYALSHSFARYQERRVVPGASQIIVVSARYKENLLRRHRSLDAANVHVLPFGGAPDDFASKPFAAAAQSFFHAGCGMNWAYVGRGGPAMHLAATAFLLALRRAIDEGIVDPAILRLHCIGTAYATGERATSTFAPLAAAAGVADQVREHTARVPHFTALRCLRDADALIVFGSDDPGYAASKIMPSIFAQRPLLGIFHEASSCVNLLRGTGGGVAVTFSSGEDAKLVADRIYRSWFVPRRFNFTPAVPAETLAPHSAAEMTRRLCTIFQRACLQQRAAIP